MFITFVEFRTIENKEIRNESEKDRARKRYIGGGVRQERIRNKMATFRNVYKMNTLFGFAGTASHKFKYITMYKYANVPSVESAEYIRGTK